MAFSAHGMRIERGIDARPSAGERHSSMRTNVLAVKRNGIYELLTGEGEKYSRLIKIKKCNLDDH